MSFNTRGFNRTKFNVITSVTADRNLVCSVPTVSTTAGALSSDKPIATVCGASCNVTGVMINELYFTSTVQCESTIADITIVVEYYIQLDSVDTSCTITTSLSVDRTIIGLIGGAASLSQHIVVTYSCVSSLTPTSVCTAGLSSDIVLSSPITCESTVSGILDRSPPISTSISSISAVAGTLSVTKPFTASISGISAVSGQAYPLLITCSYTPPDQFILVEWGC